MGQTIAEALIEEGMAKGALATARKFLRTVLETRFGAVPEAMAQWIESATDLQRLQAALVQAAVANHLDEVQL